CAREEYYYGSSLDYW
nr:immunoglobulin heavy chain junction region [Mus musculus]MBK4187117.1 immunoglobulin heavy chain junction region [Mus musculus]MBK4187118.1 immunoglobulin heavy chain junction region [Mus musculus]MBK4195177.1 immunoglobulin heavy chain junction region [Mus musculus]